MKTKRYSGLFYRLKKMPRGEPRHFLVWNYPGADGEWKKGSKDIGFAPTKEIQRIIELSRLPITRRRHRISVTPWLKKGGVRSDDKSFMAALLLRLEGIKKSYKQFGPPRPPRWKRPAIEKLRPPRNLFSELVSKACGLRVLVEKIERGQAIDKWSDEALETAVDSLGQVVRKYQLCQNELNSRLVPKKS